MQEKENTIAAEAADELAETAAQAEETTELEQPAAPESDTSEDAEEPAEKTPVLQKLFTLKFNLPLEEYLEFYRVMNAENVKKNKKKMTIMGAAEILIGLILVGTSIAGLTTATPLSWLLLAIIFFLGFRSMTYYKLFYEKALVKAVTKEYNKLTYLRQDMNVDFYPNRCVEHVQDKDVETFWHTIHAVRESKGLFMIMLEPRRCLLLPKSQLGDQREAVERLVEDICQNYEKKRYEV